MAGEKLDGAINEEFTSEELAALGEDVEEKKEEKAEEGETGEVEEKAAEGEEQKAETKENLIPQSAFDKRVAEIRTQSEQKLDLLKTNPEEYYRRFPDERPATKAAPADKDFESGKPVDTGKVEDVLIEGGNYDGWKFGDVFKRDPVTAYKISPYHARLIHDQQLDSEREQRSSVERLKEESEKEVISFSASIAKELFEKSDDLTPEQTKEVESVLNKTLDWMGKTGRGGGILADAYTLMNIGSEKKKAAVSGAKAVIDAGRKGRVQTISSSASSGSLTGYEAIEAMSADELAFEIGSWPEKKYSDFLKNAPKSIRKKLPNIPWD